MENNTKKITIFEKARYEIKVQGYLDEHFANRNTMLEVKQEDSCAFSPIATILCTVDQAGLLGVLRHLNTLGLPLISIIHLSC